jgi:DNA-binding transcriptional LysR family regulator
MVAQGLGTGILPEAALRPFAEVLGLKILHLEDPWAVRHLDLCWYAGHEPEAPTQKLIDALIRQ